MCCRPKNTFGKIVYIMTISFLVTVFWYYATSPKTYIDLYTSKYVRNPSLLQDEFETLKESARKGVINTIKDNLVYLQGEEERRGIKEHSSLH
jgi:hypothetical protein